MLPADFKELMYYNNFIMFCVFYIVFGNFAVFILITLVYVIIEFIHYANEDML